MYGQSDFILVSRVMIQSHSVPSNLAAVGVDPGLWREIQVRLTSRDNDQTWTLYTIGYQILFIPILIVCNLLLKI